MFLVVLNHDVEDYDKWKQMLDEFMPSKGRAQHHSVCRSVDNPYNVTVIASFESEKAATAFRDNPEFKDAMGLAGVDSTPRFEIFEQIETVDSRDK